jgi:hypothetical protein
MSTPARSPVGSLREVDEKRNALRQVVRFIERRRHIISLEPIGGIYSRLRF